MCVCRKTVRCGKQLTQVSKHNCWSFPLVLLPCIGHVKYMTSELEIAFPEGSYIRCTIYIEV